MDVGKALRNTSKGRLKYDKFWSEKDFLEYVSQYSTNVSINVSPKVLSFIINQEQQKTEEDVNIPTTKPSPKKSDTKCKESDTLYFEQQTETELPIIEYEEERLKSLQDKFEAKKEEYDNFSKNIRQQTYQQYDLIKRNKELDGKKKAADLKKIEDAVFEEIKEKERLLTHHRQTQAKKLSDIVQEAEMKQKKAEEELRKKEQEQKEFVYQLNNYKLEVENLILKAETKLKACEHPTFLKISMSERMNQMTKLLEDINIIVDGAKFQSLTIEDVMKVNIFVKKTFDILQDVANDIEHAKVKALQEHEKKLLESKEIAHVPKENNKFGITKSESVAANEISVVRNDGQNLKIDKVIENNKNKLKNEALDIISSFIAPDVVEEYHTIMENLKTTTKNVQGFIDDPRNKKYRFELLKSINMPINAISSISGSHVRDKISRLLTILSSKSKENNNDPVPYYFCANLIAKKFVEQGDKQIAAQHSTAFPIALAVIGVWVKKPDVGTLILGHFYSNCPYLVPYYPPRKEDQSDQQYYESLGYYFDGEGNMEPRYKFLSRMSGFMRLYAAILISPVPPSSTKYPHPHGIAYGWRWLSRILNLDPRPDITATLLFDFLEVTGHFLQKTYGKQFKKLLHIICKDFFQKIRNVTPSGSSGPVERLETFLQQTVKKGYIPPPEGVLSAGFWSR